MIGTAFLSTDFTPLPVIQIGYLTRILRIWAHLLFSVVRRILIDAIAVAVIYAVQVLRP